jgi:hypothetical protein
MKPATLFLLTILAGSSTTHAASMNEMDHGPFVSWTIRGEGDSVTYKGIAIKLPGESAICFDTDLLRVSAGWSGGFPAADSNATTTGRLESRPSGDFCAGIRSGMAWSAIPPSKDEFNFAMPWVRMVHERHIHRSAKTAVRPAAGSHRTLSRLFLHGTNVVLSYSVADCDILETPGVTSVGPERFFTRTFNLGKTSARLTSCVGSRGQGTTLAKPVRSGTRHVATEF